MMKTLSIQQITFPTTFMFQILGVYFGAKRKLLITVLYLSIFGYYLLDFAQFVTRPSKFALWRVLKIVTICRIIGSVFTIVVLVLAHVKYYKNLVKLAHDIETIDKSLVELGFEKYLAKASYRHHRTIIKLIIVTNVGLNVVLEAYPVWHMPHGKFGYCISNIYPKLLISTMTMTFYQFAIIIEERFKIINKLFENGVRSRVVLLHKSLIRISRRLNSIFAIQFLGLIVLSFIVITAEMHVFTYYFVFNVSSRFFIIVFVGLKNSLSSTIEICYLTKRCSRLCYEANRSKRILLGTRIDIFRENERNKIINLALKMMRSELKISACGLFTIDNSLLYSLFGSACSYIFVMLQFDRDN
ncbi:gustatory receptor 146 [Tribolium castaneum]|uniref:Gustatory receptor n=1 Tax=Tribolium castaneum TaxID=7070 RepID=D6X4A5_TRICA|nr:PREDICTED: uncharacterized protein LOC107398842 [Tribolium castaneum]EEZ97771.1 gustatory receptor 146 [Tribolium castaneum]|eukprot:XP_015839848.1 PREDICTED: uncharacterized protein LOC107398842 [Tribolium castaneum]